MSIATGAAPARAMSRKSAPNVQASCGPKRAKTSKRSCSARRRMSSSRAALSMVSILKSGECLYCLAGGRQSPPGGGGGGPARQRGGGGAVSQDNPQPPYPLHHASHG